MRSTWEYRDRLTPPHTAVAGHSRGGGLAAQLATKIPVMAFASLSGALGDFPNSPAILFSITVPSLLLWNDVDDASIGANPDAGHLWNSVGVPGHGVVFENAKSRGLPVAGQHDALRPADAVHAGARAGR